MTELSTITVHGRTAAFRRGGRSGRDVVVLVHGIAGDSSEWSPVLDRLGEAYDVVAPDLAGHGGSTRLRGAMRKFALGSFVAMRNQSSIF